MTKLEKRILRFLYQRDDNTYFGWDEIRVSPDTERFLPNYRQKICKALRNLEKQELIEKFDVVRNGGPIHTAYGLTESGTKLAESLSESL